MFWLLWFFKYCRIVAPMLTSLVPVRILLNRILTEIFKELMKMKILLEIKGKNLFFSEFLGKFQIRN
jgi:hypothetical protein